MVTYIPPSVPVGLLNDGLYRYDFASEAWEYFQAIELGPDDPMMVITSDSINLYVGGYGMIIEGEDYYNIAQWGPHADALKRPAAG